MKLEIELDLNKIDYDAINKQIQEKIEAMDLEKTYQINYKISNKINEEVEKIVGTQLRRSRWSGELNDDSKQWIHNEIRGKIQELVNPCVTNIFDKLSQDELDEIITELIPKVLVDLLSERTKSALMSYYYESSETITRIAEDRIRCMLGR